MNRTTIFICVLTLAGFSFTSSRALPKDPVLEQQLPTAYSEKVTKRSFTHIQQQETYDIATASSQSLTSDAKQGTMHSSAVSLSTRQRARAKRTSSATEGLVYVDDKPRFEKDRPGGGGSKGDKERDPEDFPLSGYEIPYAPDEWKFAGTDDSEKPNCYAYALDIKTLGPIFPGFTEHESQPGGNEYYLKQNLERWIGVDAENLNFSFSPIAKGQRCKSGHYRIALVTDPKKDFHFYRQNPDGPWSHKRGILDLTDRDASGRVILDPQTCDRDYRGEDGEREENGYYMNFIGFYQVDIRNIDVEQAA